MAKIQDIVCDICGGSVRKDAQPLEKEKGKLVGAAIGKTVEDACFNCKRYIESFTTAFRYLKSGGKDVPAKKEVTKKEPAADQGKPAVSAQAAAPKENTAAHSEQKVADAASSPTPRA